MPAPHRISPEQRAANARAAARISARLREVDGLERHIRRVVDGLPPLTEAQRARLAALLAPPVPPATDTVRVDDKAAA